MSDNIPPTRILKTVSISLYQLFCFPQFSKTFKIKQFCLNFSQNKEKYNPIKMKSTISSSLGIVCASLKSILILCF